MATCSRFDGFSERLNMSTGREYLEIAGQLVEVADQGTFERIHADCPLRNLLTSLWPSDMIRHVFNCAGCGREHELSADTYHGNARWMPK